MGDKTDVFDIVLLILSFLGLFGVVISSYWCLFALLDLVFRASDAGVI